MCGTLCLFVSYLCLQVQGCIGHEGKTKLFCLVDRCLSFCTFLLVIVCLFFFDIRILITPLVSSNSSCFFMNDFLEWVMRLQFQNHFRDAYVCGKAFDVFIKMTAFNFQSCLIFVSCF